MAKKRRKNDKTSEIAAPVREFLRHIIRNRVQSKADREALARFLGQAPTSVSNLLKGEGGLDTWVAALVFCFDLDAKKMVGLAENFQAMAQMHYPRESDRIAARIRLPENKRKILFSALLTALSFEESADDVPLLMAAEGGRDKKGL